MQARGLISTLLLLVLTLGGVLLDLRAESASGSYLLAPDPTPSPVRKKQPAAPSKSPARSETTGSTQSETVGQARSFSLPEKDDEVLIKKPSGSSGRSARTRRGRTETVDNNESITINGAKSLSKPALKTRVKRTGGQDIEVENDETHATGATRQLKSPASAGQLPNAPDDQQRETAEGFTSAEGRSMSFELKTQKPSDRVSGDRSGQTAPKIDVTEKRKVGYIGETERNLNSAQESDQITPPTPRKSKTGEVAIEELHVKKTVSNSDPEQKRRTSKARRSRRP